MRNKTTLQNTLKSPLWSRGLTEKQQAFVLNYADGTSKTYLNVLSSYIASGYSADEKKPLSRLTAQKFINTGKIQKALLLYHKSQWEKLEVNRGYTLQRLCDTYDRAVQSNDGSTQLGCVKLMMQYNNMLTVNLNITSDYSKTYDAAKEQEIKVLASMRIAGILESTGQSPLTLSSGALKSDMAMVDSAGPDDGAIDALFESDCSDSATDDDDSLDDDDSNDS